MNKKGEFKIICDQVFGRIIIAKSASLLFQGATCVICNLERVSFSRNCDAASVGRRNECLVLSMTLSSEFMSL